MNNKMKKFSKILMMTVAILLTLVLASTSVVSGIFAKYVVTKTATATVSLQKFGLTLKVEAGSGVTATPTTAGDDTIAITINSLQLTPGQTIPDAIKFTIGGKSNVAKVNLKVSATVNEYVAVTVPEGIGGLNSAATYLPIMFTTTVDSTKTTLYNHWQSPNNGATIQSKMTEGLGTALDVTPTGGVAEKTICTKAGEESLVKTLNFGFAWEDGNKLSSGLNSEEIGTYIAGTQLLKVKVTYTVTLQQG